LLGQAGVLFLLMLLSAQLISGIAIYACCELARVVVVESAQSSVMLRVSSITVTTPDHGYYLHRALVDVSDALLIQCHTRDDNLVCGRVREDSAYTFDSSWLYGRSGGRIKCWRLVRRLSHVDTNFGGHSGIQCRSFAAIEQSDLYGWMRSVLKFGQFNLINAEPRAVGTYKTVPCYLIRLLGPKVSPVHCILSDLVCVGRFDNLVMRAYSQALGFHDLLMGEAGVDSGGGEGTYSADREDDTQKKLRYRKALGGLVALAIGVVGISVAYLRAERLGVARALCVLSLSCLVYGIGLIVTFVSLGIW
jgi:hypothetical protein